MTERPILFSGPMVRALLDGRKTQTRRIVKAQFAADAEPEQMSRVSPEGFQMAGHSGRWWDAVTGSAEDAIRCPYGAPGDALWVKETWRPSNSRQPWDIDVRYAADGAARTIKDGEFGERDWTMPKVAASGNVSPLFMPRWASRLTLEITDVRVERLQAISAADARAEGCDPVHMQPGGPTGDPGDGWLCYREGYAALWDTINSKGSWAANPWIWAVSFRVAS